MVRKWQTSKCAEARSTSSVLENFMHFVSPKIFRAGAVVALALAVGAAQAHPLGADHLLAMLAVGIWSVSALPANKTWWGPATFMLTLVASAALGAAGFSLPGLESLISLSVVLFGGMLLLSRAKLPTGLGLGLIALAASLHGLAHGAETPDTGFATYAAGFLVTTATLHFGGVAMGLSLRKVLADKATWALTGLGALCSGAGLYLFSQV
jgi:urease accessory protein